MRFVFYTNNVSPHQLPLAEEVASRVGRDGFLYVGEELEWRGKLMETSVRTLRADDAEAKEWLENADVMYTGGLRPIDLMERRAKRGLKSLYYSERWFKPVELKVQGSGFKVPGWVRMAVPGYRKMARRFVRVANENDCVKFLPIGPWSAQDFMKMGVRTEKMVDWGYFVSPSVAVTTPRGEDAAGMVKILWVGRMIGLKRVETIIRAANELKVQGLKFKVTLVGDGPEKGRLQRMARSCTSGKDSASPLEIEFLPRQPLEKIRELMRQYDLYVQASDACEGWGAVVNEALEEGMSVIGTFEAGASAAMLPKGRLYHAGDWRALARLIGKESRGELPPCSIGKWTAVKAAERLLAI